MPVPDEALRRVEADICAEVDEGSPNADVSLLAWIPSLGAVICACPLTYFGFLGFWLFTGILAVAILWLIAMSAYHGKRQHRRVIRARLVNRGYDICIGCGYWMGKLPDSVTKCPECGFTCQGTGVSPPSE